MLIKSESSKGIHLNFHAAPAGVQLSILLGADHPWRNATVSLPDAEALCLELIAAIKAARKGR
jgi:hypothetical protein